jgi:outer membrane immunogenic protein
MLSDEGHTMRLSAAALALSAAFVATGASAQDAAQWTGFYAGFQTTIIAPEFDNSPATIPLQEGTNFGAYGGYNYAMSDSFVLGAEVSIGGPTAFQTSLGVNDFELENVVNARVRGGYAYGSALLYGSVGYQSVNYEQVAGVTTASGSADGVVYGIGIEMLLSDNVSFRLDYTSTHMDLDAGSIVGGAGNEQIDANAVGLGVALHF